MTGGALLGAGLVAVGAAVWAFATATLVRANPAERFPRHGAQGWRRYLVTYGVSLFVALLGILRLQDEVGLWAAAVGVVVWVAPQQVVRAAHRRRVERRTAQP